MCRKVGATYATVRVEEAFVGAGGELTQELGNRKLLVRGTRELRRMSYDRTE